MKPTFENPAIEIDGDFEVSEVSAKGRGLKMLIWAARDGTYDDKPLAVCREYTFNGLDEHRKHKIKRPIEIHCPTEADPEFRLRDFALGLPDDKVRFHFGMMGESDKGAEDVGGFGFGAKVGNSYADSFFVESYYGGECRIYQFFLTPADDPCDPPTAKIALISIQPSDEPTGLMIRVPVKPEDISQFERSLQRVCFYIEGEYTCNKEFRHAEFKEFQGVKYCKAHSDSGFYMAQGGCVYAADAVTLLDGSGLERWASELNGYCLILPKNSFKFVISREHVAKNAMSQRVLANAVQAVQDHFFKLAERVVDFDLFQMVRFLNRYDDLGKYLKLAAPDWKDKFKTSTSYCWKGYPYPVKRYYDDEDYSFTKSQSYKMSIPKPKGGNFATIWYVPKDKAGRKRHIVYAIDEHQADEIWVLDDAELKEVQEHPILSKCIKNVLDLEVPRGYNSKNGGASGVRGKIAVQVGNMDTAKWYLISNYGKVKLFGSEYKVKHGMPYELRKLGMKNWVVIIPKSESKKIEGSGLKPFREDLGYIKRKRKQEKNQNYLSSMGRCPYGSMWLKHKGLLRRDKLPTSTQCWLEDRAKKIKKKIGEIEPIWEYAIEGGGVEKVYEEMERMGLTKELVNV